jgi:hypothetical protein
MKKDNLVCEFEYESSNLQNLIHKIEVLFQLCDRNPLYYFEHVLKINDTSTLSIKLYKNDRYIKSS